ncbi:hypothetical protein [Amycolatopsis antarctica]|nr:hypothetical protein [Amycolatopsis antarctica]
MNSDGKADRQLAWELHVELATRVSATELAEGQGLLTEALSSLHAVFGTARAALAAYPSREIEDREDSVPALVTRLLNNLLRPFLSKWHPRLLAYEELRPDGIGSSEHESVWEHSALLRAELAELQALVREVARRLADIAQVVSLVPAEQRPVAETA